MPANVAEPEIESPFDMERLRAQLDGCAVGHTIEYYRSIESTMAPAHTLAQQPDVRSGAIVLSDEQTAGRGRLERRWDAPFGRALLVSVSLRGESIQSPHLLPLAAGSAVLAALKGLGLPDSQFGLKWPNDIVCGERDGRQRKIGGILVESALSGAEIDHAVIGIGINVNQRPDDLPHVELPAPQPASLLMETGAPLDRTTLLIELCRALAHTLTLHAAELLRHWQAHLWTLNREVTVHRADGSHFTGRAVAITDSGALRVQSAEGMQTVEAGDVSLRDPQ